MTQDTTDSTTHKMCDMKSEIVLFSLFSGKLYSDNVTDIWH